MKISKMILITTTFWLSYSFNLIGQVTSTPVTRSWQEYSKNSGMSLYKGLEWELIGPVMNSGRVESVAVDPYKSGTIYAGFGSG